MILRRIIIDLRKDNSVREWPPSAKNLLGIVRNIPYILEHFLMVLLSGATVPCKAKSLANSYGQDPCHAVTNSKVKMPKHLLLDMTLRQMTGSAVNCTSRFLNLKLQCATLRLIEVQFVPN